MAEQGESLLGSWSKIKGGNFEGVPVQQLMRIVIKTTSGETGEERLEKSIAVEEVIPTLGHVDYIKCHPKFTGKKSRYVWGALSASSPSLVAPGQKFCRIDLKTKQKVDEWYAGERKIVDDFILIEKKRKSENDIHDEAKVSSDDNVSMSEKEEEEGVYLLAPVFDGKTNTSSFVVLDGQNLSAGPIFEVKLNSHIPWGLHGSFSYV